MTKQNNLLIADDDQDLVALMKDFFAGADWNFFPARNGAQAVSIARTHPMDVAVLDLKMPVMDGLAALKEIKALDTNTEVIIMTAYGHVESLNEILDQGAFDYVLKPFHRTEIVHTVRNALLKRKFAIENNRMREELKERIAQLERDFEERTRQLRESQVKYKLLVEHSNDAIVVTEADTVRFANPKALELAGRAEKEFLGTPFLELIYPDDRFRVKEGARRMQAGEDLAPVGTIRAVRRSGDWFWAEIHTVRTSWEGRPATIHFVRDVSEQKQTEDRLRHLGCHDALTGLYNRAFFEEELARLERGRKLPVSVVMADVDDLKAVNDSGGHAAGDEILRAAASVLAASCRADDVVARIGGDEFVILLPETDSPTVREVVARIQDNLEARNEDGTLLPLGLSLGTATAEKGASLGEAVRRADMDMYRAKPTPKDAVP